MLFYTNYDYHPQLNNFNFLKVDNLIVKDLTNHLLKLHAKIKT